MGDSYKVVRIVESPSFLKKHSGWMTVIGALIVFSTFVIKEGMRDHLKDQLDQLESARALFQLRLDNNITLSQLMRIQQHIGYKNDGNLPSQYVTDARRRLTLNPLLSYVGNSLDTSTEFLQSIPHPAELDERLSLAKKDLANLRNASKESQKVLSKLEFAETGKNTKALSASANKEEGNVQMQILEAEQLEFHAKFIAKDSLKAADSNRARLEGRYRRYAQLSTLLYIVGWSMALFGKLFGIGGLSGD